VTFKIKDDAELGAADVCLDVQEFKRINGQYGLEDLVYTVSNGGVLVAEGCEELGHSLGQPEPTSDPAWNVVYCERVGCDYSENVPSGYVPITSLVIDAPVIVNMVRGEVRTFGLVLNPGASGDNVVWTVSDSSFALVEGATVYILSKTGTVRLIATDPVSGLSHSITLRIT